MTRRNHSPDRTAEELMAELANDKDYQKAKAEREKILEARVAEWRKAEKPIIRELARVGVKVSSVWELHNRSAPYPSALPVLMKHLEQGGYPDRVMEGVGRALAVKPSVAYWDRLTALYRASRTPKEKDVLAIILAACVTKECIEELIEMFGERSHGDSRIFFVRPIWSLGGDRGKSAVESMRDDPDVGKEATARVARSKKR